MILKKPTKKNRLGKRTQIHLFGLFLRDVGCTERLIQLSWKYTCSLRNYWFKSMGQTSCFPLVRVFVMSLL